MESPQPFEIEESIPEECDIEGKIDDHFIVEDLLDFPKDDGLVTDGTFDNTVTGGGASTDSSSVKAVETSYNSSFSPTSTELHQFPGDIGSRKLSDGPFSGELCVPYDAHLEWLSKFVEESFSSEDSQKMELISGTKTRTDEASANHLHQPEVDRAHCASMVTKGRTGSCQPKVDYVNYAPIVEPEMSLPTTKGVRTKRKRAAPCNWTSHLLTVSSLTDMTTTATTTPPTMITPPTLSSSSESAVTSGPNKKTVKVTTKRKDNGGTDNSNEGRKCMHCDTDKTPQWRTGPMGPKTLCNACGVRYKSGRLVPEYRPASSPTFTLTKHSNSHRKVLEIRRQKEVSKARQHQNQQQVHHRRMMFDVPNGGDYLLQPNISPEFQQNIGPNIRHLL